MINQCHRRDRHGFEYTIISVLLRTTTRKASKLIGKLKSFRRILIQVYAGNPRKRSTLANLINLSF